MSLFEYYNPNPKGKLVTGCVKRCLSKATGEAYIYIQRQLNAIHREFHTTDYRAKKVWLTFIERHGYKKFSIPVKKGTSRITVADLARQQAANVNGLANYRIVCRCAKHLVCVAEGKYWDTWDSGDCCVYTSWLVPIHEEQKTVESDEIAKLESEIEAKRRALKEQEKELKKLERKLNKLKDIPTNAQFRKDFDVIEPIGSSDPYGPCWIRPKENKKKVV